MPAFLRRYSIQKLIGLLIASVLVATAAMALGFVRWVDQQTLASLDERVTLSANAVGDAVEPRLRRFREELEVVERRAPAVLDGEAGCEYLLPGGMEFLQDLTNVVLLRPDGSVVCSGISAPTGRTPGYGDRYWFQAALQTDTLIVSEPLPGKHSGTWAQAWARRVVTEEGRRGVVAIGVDLVHVQDILGQPSLPDGSTVVLVDRDGVILSRSLSPEAWVGRRLRTATYRFDQAVSEHVALGWGEMQEGLWARIASRRLEPFGWTVAAAVPERVLTAARRKALGAALPVGLGVWLFIAAVALAVGRRVRRESERLKEYARAVARDPSLIYDADGPDEYRGVGRELESMAVALRRALEAERTFGGAVRRTQDVVIVTNRDGLIEYVNPAFERISGYRMAEVVGRTPAVIRSDRQDDAFYARMWERLLRAETFRGKVVNRAKDGGFFTLEQVITPVLSEEGEVTHFVATGRDVTGQEALERAVRRAEKMEAIGQVAGGVAHDFNNILTAIQGYALLLQEEYTEGESREYVEEILNGTKMAGTLTRQLLTFGRRNVDQPERVDLNELVERVARFLQRVLPADIELQIEPDPRAGAVIMDPGSAEQVLLNLCVNARDAMPDGGVLRIETRGEGRAADIESLAARTDCGVLIVSDTGCGMDGPTLQRIFEPLYTTKEHGTGVGLATVNTIVDDAGGAIEVESRPGDGTTFRVFLPYVPQCHTEEIEGPDPDEGAGAPLPVGPQSGATVLLAEDSPQVREVLRDSLREVGYRVITAPNGEEAMRVALDAGESIDVLVTDIMMPHAKGPEVYRGLKEHFPGLKGIFISGYAGSRGEDWDDDVVFIPKPFKTAVLVREIERARAAGGGRAGPVEKGRSTVH